jgi:FixJ family two-component response regulator
LRRQGYRVPFIFITAVPDEDVRRQALNDGAICFLTKPFDEDILINCLDSAVQRYRGN